MEMSDGLISVHGNDRKVWCALCFEYRLVKDRPQAEVDTFRSLLPEIQTYRRFQKHTKGEAERFLIIHNKTKCKFSRESCSSQPRTIQNQTDNLADAGWVLPERCVHDVCLRHKCLIGQSHFVHTRLEELSRHCLYLARGFEEKDSFENLHIVLYN